MCSTLITKAINGMHYKESNQAEICQICHNLSPPNIHALHYLVVFFNIIWRFGELFSYCKHVFFPYCIQIININTTTLLGNSKIQNTEQQVKQLFHITILTTYPCMPYRYLNCYVSLVFFGYLVFCAS